MEITQKKSQEQADIIQLFNILYVPRLDTDYLKQCAHDMFAQADRQETLMVLNPSYPQVKNQIIRAQATALQALCEYVDNLKKVDQLKSQLKTVEEEYSVIAKLFL